MVKMTTFLFTVLYALAVLFGNSNGRVLQTAGGPAPVPSTPRMCSDSCKYPMLFKSVSPSQPISYACKATTPSGVVTGYQLSSGPATCVLASGNQKFEAMDYDCMCLDAGQIQGLDLPGPSGGCKDSCSQGVNGMVGTPVQTGSSYACLSTTEIGVTNRFGHTESNTCISATAEGILQNSNQFSCVCTFSVAKPAAATIQAAQKQISTSTAG